MSIKIDGNAVDANLINVIPHITDNAHIAWQGLIESVTITKMPFNDPPTINNIDQKTYTATPGEYAFNIDYLPCTIKPDEWTKVGTIVVVTDQHPATAIGGDAAGSIGHFHMKDVPYLQNLTSDGTGLPLYELVRTVTPTNLEIDTDSGATKRMDFDIMFKDSNSHELVGGEWPTNYDTVASRDDSIGVRLVVPRPILMFDTIADNVIEVINIGDFGVTLADIEAEELLDSNVPDKTFESGSSPLQPVPVNPGNVYMPNTSGNINKVTESEPNPISIQGTPGSQFQLEFVEGNFSGTSTNKSTGEAGDATGGKWATSSTDEHGAVTITPKTFTIPESGTWVGALTNVPQIAATNTGKELELKVTAVGGSTTISTSAGRPQSVGSISAIANNNAVYKFTQPCSSVDLKIKLTTTGSMGTYSTAKAGEYGVSGDDHIILNVTGFGTSNYNSNYNTYVAEFTATREGAINGVDDGRTAVLTGVIDVVKFGGSDLELVFDWDDFVETSNRATTGWSTKGTYTDFYTAGLSEDGNEFGTATWTGANTTGAEVSIVQVNLTITN